MYSKQSIDYIRLGTLDSLQVKWADILLSTTVSNLKGCTALIGEELIESQPKLTKPIYKIMLEIIILLAVH